MRNITLYSVLAKYYFIIFIILLKYGQIDFMTSQKLIQVCMIWHDTYDQLLKIVLADNCYNF